MILVIQNTKKKYINYDEEDYKCIKGTREYLSINSHLTGHVSSNDDTESMIYTLLDLTKIGLLWKNLNCKNNDRYKETLKMKINFDSYEHCGEEYSFLADSLEYIKMQNSEKNKLIILC